VRREDKHGEDTDVSVSKAHEHFCDEHGFWICTAEGCSQIRNLPCDDCIDALEVEDY
jgi:hypothetical protein